MIPASLPGVHRTCTLLAIAALAGCGARGALVVDAAGERPRDAWRDGLEETGAGEGCLAGTARLDPALLCVGGDPSRDGIGQLCVAVFTALGPPPPDAALGRVCLPEVDLCSAAVPFRVRYAAPPGEWVWVTAFLAEENPSSPPKGPRPGDPWLDPPLAVMTTSTCVAVPLVLAARY